MSRQQNEPSVLTSVNTKLSRKKQSTGARERITTREPQSKRESSRRDAERDATPPDPSLIPRQAADGSSCCHTVRTMRWLLVFSGVLACAGRPVSSSCPVQISPPTVVVRFGDPLRIICSSTSDQIESIGLESMYGGEKTAGVSSVVLNITSVEHWEVLVICFLNRVKVGQCSENFPVTVYKAPDRVSISQPSLTAPLVEGETYSLKCDVVNVAPIQNLSVHWYKGEKILRTERFHGSSKAPVNATSVFNLTAQRGDDQTRIRCEAQLDLDTVPSLPAIKSESRAVIVQYPPTFAQPENKTMEFPAGGNFSLDCAATGNPTPKYSWQVAHAKQLTAAKGNQSVWAPSFPHPGTYKCTASNTRGSATKYFTVTRAAGNRTTFGALVGVFVFLAVVISIGGLLTLTPNGNFSLKGRPASSAPI